MNAVRSNLSSQDREQWGKTILDSVDRFSRHQHYETVGQGLAEWELRRGEVAMLLRDVDNETLRARLQDLFTRFEQSLAAQQLNIETSR